MKAIFMPGELPSEGLMSAPIFLRHLQYFKEVKETVVATFEESPTTLEYAHLRIPLREWWWPPRALLPNDELHTMQRARYIISKLQLTSEDCVIARYPFEGVLIGAAIKKLCGSRLIIIVHESHLSDLQRPDLRAALGSADRIRCVSASLCNLFFELNKNTDVLLPIPGKHRKAWKSQRKGPIALIGSYNDKQLEIAERFATETIALGPYLPTKGNQISFIPRFEKNEAAINFVAENCSAAWVIVPNSNDHYSQTSFPSKFLDLLRTGLPIIIVAPATSPIGQWAKSTNFPTYIDNETDLTQFQRVKSALHDPIEWQNLADLSADLSAGPFSAESINQDLFDSVFPRLAL